MSTKQNTPAGAGGGGGAPPGQWTLCKVRIVYRNPGGQVKEKDIDLDQAGGLWWNNPTPNPGPGVGPKVPGKVKPVNESDCPPAVPAPDHQCWWDPNQNRWICPDGWE